MYRFIDNYWHLEILRCLCVVTSWLPSIRLPASACIGLLCARKSMSVDSQHQYIVFLQQFLKGGFYTVKNWAPPTSDTTRSSKRRFLHSQKGKFLFHFSPPVSMHTILIQASTFSTVWVKRGFYIGKIGEFQRNVPFPRPFTQSGCWVVPW